MMLKLTEGGKAKYQKAKTDYELSDEQLLQQEIIKTYSNETSYLF